MNKEHKETTEHLITEFIQLSSQHNKVMGKANQGLIERGMDIVLIKLEDHLLGDMAKHLKDEEIPNTLYSKQPLKISNEKEPWNKAIVIPKIGEEEIEKRAKELHAKQVAEDIAPPGWEVTSNGGCKPVEEKKIHDNRMYAGDLKRSKTGKQYPSQYVDVPKDFSVPKEEKGEDW